MKNVDPVQGNPIVEGAFSYRKNGKLLLCSSMLHIPTDTVGFKVAARWYKRAQLNERGKIIRLS
jgi:hypothetical protein